jgi:hypothetical protein
MKGKRKSSRKKESAAINRRIKFVAVNRNKQCSVCGKVFKTSTYRKHHEQNVHNIDKGIDKYGRRTWTREYD